jgi:hypothetical protein
MELACDIPVRNVEIVLRANEAFLLYISLYFWSQNRFNYLMFVFILHQCLPSKIAFYQAHALRDLT